MCTGLFWHVYRSLLTCVHVSLDMCTGLFRKKGALPQRRRREALRPRVFRVGGAASGPTPSNGCACVDVVCMVCVCGRVCVREREYTNMCVKIYVCNQTQALFFFLFLFLSLFIFLSHFVLEALHQVWSRSAAVRRCRGGRGYGGWAKKEQNRKIFWYPDPKKPKPGPDGVDTDDGPISPLSLINSDKL